MKVDIDTSDKLYADAWLGFKGTDWKNEINVRDFIQHNYTPYEGDESFLAEATPATTELWEKVMEGIRIENATHAPLDFDTNIATTITAHDAVRYTALSPPSSGCWTRKTRRPCASPLTAGSQPSATRRTRTTRPSASPCRRSWPCSCR